MTLTEKAAYLKGLANGLALDENKPETKLINAMIDLIDDIALTVADLDDELAVVSEQVDLIDEDLESLEDDFYEDEEDEEEDDLIKITCPTCGDEIYIDDAILNDGELKCPNCGETLEFEIEYDCECGCDCDDCDCDCGEEK